MILHDRVTRLRASLTDGPYGNQQRDWANASSVDLSADVQPVSSTEDVVNQQQTVTRWRLTLYPSSDLEPTDRVVWDGDTYEVEGAVERWKRRGAVHHLRAVLMRVEQGA